MRVMRIPDRAEAWLRPLLQEEAAGGKMKGRDVITRLEFGVPRDDKGV